MHSYTNTTIRSYDLCLGSRSYQPWWWSREGVLGSIPSTLRHCVLIQAMWAKGRGRCCWCWCGNRYMWGRWTVGDSTPISDGVNRTGIQAATKATHSPLCRQNKLGYKQQQRRHTPTRMPGSAGWRWILPGHGAGKVLVCDNGGGC